jgi:SAM-dependent methyltransferase
MSKNSGNKYKNNIFSSYVGDELTSNITALFNQTKKGEEYEFIFFGRNGKYLPQEKYIGLLKYFNMIAAENPTVLNEPDDTLDIVYRSDNITFFRLTLTGADTINSYMKKLSAYQNHVVFRTFVKMWSKGDKKISLMKKIKTTDRTIDIDELDLRVRLSDESEVTKDDIAMLKELDETHLNKINYRYKQRTTLTLYDKANEIVRADLTYTRNTNVFKKVNKAIPNYELEIEYVLNGSKPTTECFDALINGVCRFLKLIQQSNFIITSTVASSVIESYVQILGLDEDAKKQKLSGRQPISLELQHVSENLPNKYAVTDKADGERCFLIIKDLHVYLIDNNLNVKDIGIQIDKKLSRYEGSILDGEYIFFEEHNRHAFMAFDCLKNGNTNVMPIVSLFERLAQADDIISNCFVFDKQKGFKFANVKVDDTKFNLDKYVEAYTQDLAKYISCLNHDIELHKQYPLIRRKYFIGCSGAKSWEIFAYSVMLYNAFTTDSNIDCPYLLDGLIYQPLEQAYITSVKDSSKSDYKWKPQTKNSIDFYIEFEKDRETGKVLTIYDNSQEDNVKNKPYKICNLYVGQRGSNGEQPVLFKPDQDLYMSYLFVDNGEVRDADGNILTDGTVVEFYYNTNPETPLRFKWSPIRTRYDKTESVTRYGRQYGNYITVAEKVWRSIINPVLMSDFEDLAKGNNPDRNIYQYDKKMEAIRQRIGHELIVSASKENAYYQQTSKLAKPMREFHNWIKSNMIYTICHPMYQSNKQLSVLDLACGRGGDIMKFYYAMTNFYVGVDIDAEGIESPVNGCKSRYNEFRRNKPNFPKMYFIQGDAGTLLNYEDQNRQLGSMSGDNRNLLEKFFSKDEKKRTMFDRINCQFAVHYMFKNQTTLNNFKQNINAHLRNSGYFICTTFDARKIMKLLDGKERYDFSYTDDDGKKKILFEIVKKYVEPPTKSTIMGTSNAIDVYMAWISEEGRYLTEYLVDPQYFEKEMLEHCDLELVDSDGFDNQYEIHRDFFTGYAKFDVDTPLLGRIGTFYKNNEINDGCVIYNSLMRYYVFRKKDGNEKGQKGGGDGDSSEEGNNNNEYDFSDTTKFYVPSMTDYTQDYSALNSVHQLMHSHKIIPKHVTPEEMYEDFKIDVMEDKNITENGLKSIGKKLVFEHSVGKTNDVVIDGLNIFTVERDCNDEYNITQCGNNKKSKAVILIKEGDWHVPLYKISNHGKRKGIFKMSDPMIQWMIDNK